MKTLWNSSYKLPNPPAAISPFAEICFVQFMSAIPYCSALPTGVDCLGKSCLFGVGIDKSEKFIESSKLIETISLNKPRYSSGVLMHDEGSAFEGIAEQYGMSDINCTTYTVVNGDISAGGLGELYDEFQNGFNRMLYNSAFDSDKKLVEFLVEL